MVDGVRHERLPGLAGGDGHEDPATGRVVSLVVGSDTGGRDLDDRSGKAVIGDDDVAPAGQDEDRLARFIAGADGVDQVLLGLGTQPGARRSTQPQRRVVLEQFEELRHGAWP